jgi:glyoxylase-like metal-dependent hydrolase (beta-lactamase superfamily II)
VYDPGTRVIQETCNAGTFAESGGTNPHFVPHLLPGRELFINEWLSNEPWVPFDAVRGGVKTLYPEYRQVLAGEETVADLDVPSSSHSSTAQERIRAQAPEDGDIHILPVQGNIYMVMANGRNIAVSVGDDGAVLVNTGPENMTNEIMAAMNELLSRTSQTAPLNCFGMNCSRTPSGWTSPYTNAVIASPSAPRPLRFIFNTSAAPYNTGGNAPLSAIGYGREGHADIIAHENALLNMSGSNDDRWSAPPEAWPGESFYSEQYKMSSYFNGEAVIAYHEPAATTDGDSIVYFRHSEVIVAGDLMDTVSYPRIYRDRGGSVQGVIEGLNHILDLAVAEYRSQGGTWIIPGRGRLSDTADVAYYRNMVQIISDRIQNHIDQGMSLEQILAARPTLDFDARYGSDRGEWTTGMFITAVYESLIDG